MDILTLILIALGIMIFLLVYGMIIIISALKDENKHDAEMIKRNILVYRKWKEANKK